MSKRQKEVRRLSKWIYAAHKAGNQGDVDVFVGRLHSIGATESEIKRAVVVLVKSHQVVMRVPQVHVQGPGPQVADAPAVDAVGTHLPGQS